MKWQDFKLINLNYAEVISEYLGFYKGEITFLLLNFLFIL